MRHGRKGCGRTDKETRRQQETTQAREARCVCLSVLGCVYASVYPSCSRWLLAISSKNDHCCRLYSYKWRVFFWGVGILPFFFSLLYVRTSCVSRHPVSYIVSACFVYRVSREHSTAAVGFHFEVHRTILSLRARRPHSENESSPFFGMYQKQHHQQQK